MKKYILLILCLLVLFGCQKKQPIIDDNEETDAVEDEVTIEKYQDDNPIVVGLYMDGKLVKEYDTVINDNSDIASFDVYFTNEENVGSTNTKNNFKKYFSNYENIDNYKIGFYISFETSEGSKEAIILDPSKMEELGNIYNYLYDDVNQADGSWYSHVEEGSVTEKTIYSSIKLYATGWAYKITSPITLMVFTYDSPDDFDETGHYRGVSSYTILIKRK